MTDNKEFTVTVPRNFTFREGWGVLIDPVFEGDTEFENDKVADIDVGIVPIREDLVEIIGNTPCMPVPEVDKHFVPIENFQDVSDLWQGDTHDLRTRWFATEGEAKSHVVRTMARWNNPEPWESFICLD